jgi:hypothetical protein
VGPAQKAGFELLAPGGRFCEIGKRDILENANMELGKFLHNISFLSVHVDMLMKENPRIFAGVMREVLSLLDSGKLSLFEIHSHPISDAHNVFKVNKTIINDREKLIKNVGNVYWCPYRKTCN